MEDKGGVSNRSVCRIGMRGPSFAFHVGECVPGERLLFAKGGCDVARLLEEIRQQPAVLGRVLTEESGPVRAVCAALAERQIDQVLIAARGTSDNAARYAKYLLGSRNGLPVALAAPSLYTIYERSPRLHNTLVIGISQSGMSPDLVAVIEDARSQGMPTLAITNAPESDLAQATAHVLHCHAGEERSVAATKSYTSQLMVLAMLSAELSGDGDVLSAIARVPDAVERTLQVEEQIADRAERYRYAESAAVVGRGYNYATALEIGLKLKELTYLRTSAYSAADFRHGPIAVVECSFPVVVVAPQGKVVPNLRDLVDDLEGRGAELVMISDVPELLERGTVGWPLAASLPEWLSAITAVLPGQLWGYHLALAKGLDPDRPRGLQKVTETR